MKVCSTCGEEKELTQFYSNGYQLSGAKKYKAKCKPCTETADKQKKQNNIKEILQESQRLLACELCGYNKNYAALCFHHMDDENKDFGIAESRTRSKKALKTEVEKCALLCHNCHMEVHYPHKRIVNDDD